MTHPPRFLAFCVLLVAACGVTSDSSEDALPALEALAAESPIPVILDTDLGTDIDDTWALGLLLASPELDLKLVVTDSGDTRARAVVAARFLDVAGRSDVPIGIGVHEERDPQLPIGQSPWAEGYELADYPGTVHEDGVQAMIDVIEASAEQLTLLAIGPVPNLEIALQRAPWIAEKVRVVAMSGSVDLGYNSAPEPAPEFNVAAQIPAARRMYEASWSLLIAPLDTAGQVKLKGELYQQLLASESRTVQAILENYRIWEPTFQWGRHDVDSESSVLFDALAVALAYRPELCNIEQVRLVVTDEGLTQRSTQGKPVDTALSWPENGRESFERFLTERLLSLP